MIEKFYYTDASEEYDNNLDILTKKENGVFYTDVDLAEKIIEELPIQENDSFVDPCCGTGSFLISLKSKGIPVENIYGADIDRGAIKIAEKYLDGGNLYNIDTISIETSNLLKKMKRTEGFDYVVGNPPYVPLDKNIVIDTQNYLFLRSVKDSGSNLFVAALYRALQMVNDNGIIAYVIPKNFLHVSSYSLLRKKILNETSILSIIDIGAYFKGVRGEQIVLILKKKYEENNTINIKKYENGIFVGKCVVKQQFYTNDIILFDSQEDFDIYVKMEKTYQKFSDICTGYVGRGKSKSSKAISGKDIRKFGLKEQVIPKTGNKVFIQNIYSTESGVIASFGGNLEAKETVTVFTDGDEKMCRYILGILHSRLCNYYLYKFCFNSSRLTMHTDAKYLMKLPLEVNADLFNQVINEVQFLEKVEYLSDDWYSIFESLNNLIYKIYRIEDSEKNYIEKEMKKIQSNRWSNGK